MRPGVDVVAPVAADPPAVQALLRRLRGLRLGPADTLTVVDNRGCGLVGDELLVATAVRTSYFARNAGAARGRAPWIAFLDADVLPPPDLLDRYLAAPVADDVAVLAGGIVDGPGASWAERYAAVTRSMSDASVLGARGPWGFAQTANVLVRRAAFEAVGGFCAGVRSGGDADLCFRLRAAGWEVEGRPAAEVVHRNRTTLAGLLGQRVRHGAGAGWLEARHPGSLPARSWPGLLWWGVRRGGAGVGAGLRGDGDAALHGLLDGPAVWAFELGRLVPNRPLRRWG